MTDIIKQHPNAVNAREISQLCKPLKELGLSYFAHARVSGNTFTSLCNNPAFGEYYLTKKYYNADIHMAQIDKFSQFVIWDTIELDNKSIEMMKEAREFGHQHLFTIIEKSPTEKNYYHFGINHDTPSINQVYLSNLDLLKLYISYFKNEVSASRDLLKAYDLKFTLEENQSGFLFNKNNLINLENSREKFLRSLSNRKNIITDINYSIPANKIILIHKTSKMPVELSLQQTKCLALLLHGLTAQAIGEILCLSKRTVESYLDNIRHLLGCKNSKELIAAYATQLENLS